MRYTHYSAEDFILDVYFQQWVYSPDDATRQFWNQFLEAHPGQTKAVEEARAFLESMGSRDSILTEDIPEDALQSIKSRINAELDSLEWSAKAAPRRTGASRKMSRRVYYMAAASIILAISVVSSMFLRPEASVAFFKRLTMEQEETLNGARRHIVLSDGTQVWLNAGSRLQYPGDFRNSTVREAYLEGEAFFDVHEDREKPFIVHTSGVSIKVLGTTFNVRSYDSDHNVETTLVSGKVSIATDQSSSATLAPNQQAVVSKRSGEIKLKELRNTESLTEWRNGWIIFQDKPFGEIRQTLGRWYNVTIDVEDRESLSCTFSGKFRDKTLKEILEIFSQTVPIRYEINGDRILIKGKLCAN